MMSFTAQRKNVAYQSDIEQGIEKDLRAIGDPGRQRQILTTILVNSIKFTSEGYVRLEAPGKTVTIQFVVEDTGIGIEEEVRKRLFKPFSQADSSGTPIRWHWTGVNSQ